MSLAVFISKIRALGNFDFDVAKEAAPLVQDAVRSQVSSGVAPDGTAWKSKKDGGKPLQNAAEHVTARSVGNTVEIALKGPEVFHNAGNGRLPKRQILPDDGTIPGYIADAMHKGAKRAFEKRGGS